MIADEDQPELQALVDHFGHGGRSEFLRVAMKRRAHDRWAEKMRGLQDRAREGAFRPGGLPRRGHRPREEAPGLECLRMTA